MVALETHIKAALSAIGADIKALFLRDLPAGGTAGQVLVKSTNADYVVGWATPAAGGGSAVNLSRHEIDFGSGKTAASFTLNVPGVTTGQMVFASVSLDMPPGVAADELEMDHISLAAHAVATDTIRVIAGAQSKLRGKRAINIMRL